MSSAPRTKLITLEIGRFIAAFCVALQHLGGLGKDDGFGPRVISGPAAAAVMFFFALSGFVIYNAHWQDSGKLSRLPRYFWRRFCRIYPVYWLSLVPVLLLLWPACSRSYLVTIFSLAPVTPFHFLEINPPAWTLRYEMTFYVMFGLALLPYARRVVLPLWLAALVWTWYGARLGLGPHPAWLDGATGIRLHLYSLFNFLFFAGLAAAWVFVRYPPPARWTWPLLGVSATLMALMLAMNDGGLHYPGSLLMPLNAVSFAAVVFALAALEQNGQLRLHRRWAILGAMSYPLYLLHAGIAVRFSVYFVRFPAARHHFTDLTLFLTVLLVSLLAAFLVVVLFDAPLQRLTRKIL